MRRKIRLRALIIIWIAALGLTCADVAAADPLPVVYLAPAEQTIRAGQDAAVQVWVRDVVGLYGAEFELAFDEAIVQGVAVQAGAAFAAYPDEHQAESAVLPGIVRFAATLLRVPKAPPLSGNLHLATVTLKGVQAGTSPLTLAQVRLADQQANPIPCAQAHGRITVMPPAGPTGLGSMLKGIAVDASRNAIYVAVQSDRTVAIVDATTHELRGKVPCAGIAPNGLALSPDGGKLFVVNSGSNQVAVLDANDRYTLLRTIDVGRNPFGIAMANGTAYVTNFDDGTVTLIDVHTLAVLRTLWVGHHPSLPAATGNRAYVPVHSAFSRWESKGAVEWEYVQKNRGTDTGVAIVYGDGRPSPVERVLTEYVGFFAAAVDPAHGRAYITKRDGTAEGLYVLNLADNGLLQFVPMLRPYAVAVNPASNHVFVVQADMDEVYVLDANDGYRLVRVLNTDPNNGELPGMHGGQGIGVLGGQAFVSNFAAGTLAILDEADAAQNWPVPLDPDYIRGWQEGGGNHGPLGAPVAPSTAYWYSEQQFERGSMHWRRVPAGANQVYAFDNESTAPGGTDWTGRDDGVWQQYDDRWTPGMPLLPAACPDAWWPYGPLFGFGMAWCHETTPHGRVKDVIGYPIGWEYGAIGGDQQFANGRVFWNPASDAYYVLRLDNHRWRYYRAHRRYEDQVAPNVSGQVALQGRRSSRGALLTGPAGMRTATDEHGVFGFSYQGQVDLTIQHPGYLDVVATVKAHAGAPVDMGAIDMPGGDVNGDNRIDILDLAYIGARFGSAGPSVADADLNGDGLVDILDLSMAGGNFGQIGPVHWMR